ncbi:ectoine/hydroxyectoine ABC transporter permease subunit EhuD [Paenibacillus nasutitermitis]|uniref:Ectoine/hydroxyectoine ABC transporter permease subunit EhuD n=1 Tax=Paenibacillus nasutitermitis TaxID=1652958 RepID=A0A916Z9K9_9BACL|nr:ectoine/hydroxyectoine ABC transporter permease subunit EhuD [Paenibacillus nasutitermitis]GGD81243.1 ectoine/hydroxyectoine ABC transporter permease subunit EhuD [Paenibacillus nasutitermitis]
MWKWEYVWDLLPQLLSALRVTMYATLSGFVVAALLGLLLAIGLRSRFAVLRYTIRAIVEFIRSTPLLVQVFSLFYILPMLFPSASISAFWTGVIGLGVHYSTYLSEVYRSGIDGVPQGQWEAANALNFTKTQTWTKIILPQAIRPVVPVMGNYLIVIFKETPILMAITLVELLLTAKNAASESYRVFEPYTVVGVLFLIISLIMTYLVRLLEKKLNGKYAG